MCQCVTACMTTVRNDRVLRSEGCPFAAHSKSILPPWPNAVTEEFPRLVQARA